MVSIDNAKQETRPIHIYKSIEAPRNINIFKSLLSRNTHKDNKKIVDHNKTLAREAFKMRHEPIYKHHLVYKSALKEMRPHKKEEEAEKVLMSYATKVLAKKEYDHERALSETIDLVGGYHERL